MSKITLTDLSNLQNENTAVNAINTNNAVLEAASDNTLSRDGTSPNQMLSSLDMNSHQILNLPNPITALSPLRLQDLEDFIGSGVVEAIPAGGTIGEVLSKESNADFDVAWAPPVLNPSYDTNAIAAATSLPANIKVLTTAGYYGQGDGGGGAYIRTTSDPGHNFSIRTQDRFLPDGSSSPANGGWWLGVSNFKTINIKNHGAKGDGVTDDAPAIRSAYKHSAVGQALYVPFGRYLCNSSVNNAIIDSSNNKAVSIVGDGWNIKAGSYNVQNGSVFVLGSSLGSGVDFIHYTGTDVVFGTYLKNFAVVGYDNSFSAGVGRNIVFVDAQVSTPDFYLTDFNMEGCFFCNTVTGYSFRTFSSQSTNNGGGGLANAVIHRNQLMNIFLEQCGDNVTISSNVLGQNATVDARNIGVHYSGNSQHGVAEIRVLNNNISNFSGSIVCDGCTSTLISGNELEVSPDSTNLHGSMIDLNGFVDAITNASVIDNTISQNSLISNYIPINVGISNNTTIKGNRISIPAAYSPINVTSAASACYIGPNFCTVAGVVNLDMNVADAGAYTRIDAQFHSIIPGTTSGKTLLQASSVASGTLTLPAATDTLTGKATTDTFTNKTYDTAGSGNSFAINGLAATANTGTGSVVRSNSPTLVTPALGTPSALVGTNITGTAPGLTAGLVTTVTTNANLTGVVTSVGNATSFGSFPSSAIATALTDETGGGSVVFSNSPTLVTPVIGAATGTSLNLSGLTASSAIATDGSKNLTSVTNTGTGNNVLATSPTLVTPALGTPSALVGTNITGTASGLTSGNVTTNANLTGAITSAGNATSLGSFTSANLATALTDETGSGANVFATSPTLVTPTLGAASGTSLNLSGLTASAAVATDVSKNLVSVTNTGTGNNVLTTSPTITTPNIVGDISGGNATAGSLGEYMSNTAGAQSVTTGIGVNAAQITLTPGDWDVSLWVDALPAAATNITQITGSLSTTTATHSFAVGDFSVTNYGTTGVVLGSGAASSAVTIPKRFSVSSNTTVFGVGSTAFTVSTCQMNGFIRARRVR